MADGTAIVGVRASPAQARGQTAEALAASHLIRHGVTVIARNVRCRGGEIDLIGLHRDSVVFAEVRLRGNARYGGAAASITATKRRRIIVAAQWWLAGGGRRYAALPCRFDAVLLHELDADRIEWLQGAFAADD